jgi:cold shock CspA family protein
MNLGIALVCMVNSTALAIKDQGNDAFVNRSDIPKGCVLTEGVVNEYEVHFSEKNQFQTKYRFC